MERELHKQTVYHLKKNYCTECDATSLLTWQWANVVSLPICYTTRAVVMNLSNSSYMVRRKKARKPFQKGVECVPWTDGEIPDPDLIIFIYSYRTSSFHPMLREVAKRVDQKNIYRKRKRINTSSTNDGGDSPLTTANYNNKWRQTIILSTTLRLSLHIPSACNGPLPTSHCQQTGNYFCKDSHIRLGKPLGGPKRVN